ncbi:hypothetical protein E2C01_062490 [Portunus trituberculatus]|uniref:Uncharacterized protein n=1 Tax=Portunus trituberculatus TaxID=210409 RepID=A0A5B7HB96_PORTR|nr:hypothetical protein [Portunus trituberculatus]
MGLNLSTTINKTACATNGRKLNSASHIYSSMPTPSSDSEPTPTPAKVEVGAPPPGAETAPMSAPVLALATATEVAQTPCVAQLPATTTFTT